MTHGSLFSGIGGFDLAAEWMGWENIFHCEWNKFGQKVLNYYWPNAISYEDITKTDFTIHRGRIDILTGGFPCQPYSQAGKRKGKEDERHLWPEMLRAIREIQPRWVVGENVRGLVNWNEGLVFEEVQTDLEAEGYEVQTFLLPACGVEAPHQRFRIWFVAYSSSITRCIPIQQRGQNKAKDIDINRDVKERISSNSNSYQRRKGRMYKAKPKETKRHISTFNSRNTGDAWKNFPTETPLCDGNDGLSSKLDGITFPKWRTESIKAGGNAIVPQVVHQIFKSIQEYELS